MVREVHIMIWVELIIKDGRPYATKDLIIKFDYFEHVSGAGEDFFSVDSYTHEQAGIPYEEIPVFHPTAGPSYNQTSEENSKLLSQTKRLC